MEWAATSSEYRFRDGKAIAPISPKGSGWRLIGAIPSTMNYGDTLGVIWYWERKRPSGAK